MSAVVDSPSTSSLSATVEYRSLPDLLEQRTFATGAEAAISYLTYDSGTGCAESTWTWRQLALRAAAVAAWVQRRVAPGQPVAILADQGPEYIAAVLGVMRAGSPAVPLFPASFRGRTDHLAGILRDCRPAMVLTTKRCLDETVEFMDTRDLQVPQFAASDLLPTAMADYYDPVSVRPGDIAYLKYPSRPVPSSPRGIMVTHANVVANARQAMRAFDVEPGRSVTVSWLPLFQSMGLLVNIQLFRGGSGAALAAASS
ncbi:MAG: AMP-binding protein [Haloechinothrix sp.]